MYGIPNAYGQIPLITIQKTPEGKAALENQTALINKFKRELINGTFDLVLLVRSFESYITIPDGGATLASFYREYRSLVILRGKPPIQALELLKNPFQRGPGRRGTVRLSSGDAARMREQINEDLKKQFS